MADADDASESSAASSLSDDVESHSSFMAGFDTAWRTADTYEELIETIRDGLVPKHLRISPYVLYVTLYQNRGKNCEALFEAIEQTSSRIETLEIYAPSVSHWSWDRYADASYQDWERFGKCLGRLETLRAIHIKDYVMLDEDDDEEDDPIDYTCLGHLIRWATIERLTLQIELLNRHSLEPFLGALGKITTLQGISFRSFSEPETIDSIVSVLQRLPNLHELKFSSIIENNRRSLPDSVFHLVASNPIQYLGLDTCVLTREQCLLLSNALGTSTTLQVLDLLNARFAESGSILVAQALQLNSSVKRLLVTLGGLCGEFFGHLSRALAGESSIQSVMVFPYDLGGFDCDDLIPLFQIYQPSNSLTHLTLSHLHYWSNAAIMALRHFLEAPASRLETLSLSTQGAIMPYWRLFMPFLQVSRSLKCLFISGMMDRFGVVEAVSLLEDNTSLEVLVINPCMEDNDFSDDENEKEDHEHSNHQASKKEYITARAVQALKLNCTLRHLDIVHPSLSDEDQSDHGSKQLVHALKLNFGLGRDLSGPFMNAEDVKSGQMLRILKEDRNSEYQEEIESICLLNRAGRHYLLLDPSDRARGVQTLSAVNGNLNCLYIHLLENPSFFETPAYIAGPNLTQEPDDQGIL